MSRPTDEQITQVMRRAAWGAANTGYDEAYQGVADALAWVLGIQEIEPAPKLNQTVDFGNGQVVTWGEEDYKP